MTVKDGKVVARSPLNGDITHRVMNDSPTIFHLHILKVLANASSPLDCMEIYKKLSGWTSGNSMYSERRFIQFSKSFDLLMSQLERAKAIAITGGSANQVPKVKFRNINDPVSRTNTSPIF